VILIPYKKISRMGGKYAKNQGIRMKVIDSIVLEFPLMNPEVISRSI
jgi:hypothetical protein